MVHRDPGQKTLSWTRGNIGPRTSDEQHHEGRPPPQDQLRIPELCRARVISELYDTEVDVWSCVDPVCAVMWQPALDDENSQPFRKIMTGLFNLPNHLSLHSRDLISKMLIVIS